MPRRYEVRSCPDGSYGVFDAILSNLAEQHDRREAAQIAANRLNRQNNQT